MIIQLTPLGKGLNSFRTSVLPWAYAPPASADGIYGVLIIKALYASVSKSPARQPRQSLPGVFGVGQGGVDGFVEVEEFLIIFMGFSPLALLDSTWS